MEDLKKKIYELEREISELYRLAISLGNKHPENNFMIQDRFELLKKLKKELEELEA